MSPDVDIWINHFKAAAFEPSVNNDTETRDDQHELKELQNIDKHYQKETLKAKDTDVQKKLTHQSEIAIKCVCEEEEEEEEGRNIGSKESREVTGTRRKGEREC